MMPGAWEKWSTLSALSPSETGANCRPSMPLNNIEDVMSLNNSIERISKKIVLDIVLIAAGIALFFSSSLVSQTSDSLMLLLASAGVFVAVYGAIKLMIPSKKLFYKLSNEPLEKVELHFGNETPQQIMNKVNGLDFYSLKKFRTQDNSGMNQVIVYLTESESIRISQLLIFEHYGYNPLAEPSVKIKD